MPKPLDKYCEGPVRIYVPVCKHPRDYMFTFGPLGYEQVNVVQECPILVESQRQQKANIKHA